MTCNWAFHLKVSNVWITVLMLIKRLKNPLNKTCILAHKNTVKE